MPRIHSFSRYFASSVGAGLPANTGKAGAIHRVGFFAGKPAPTAHATTPQIFFSQQEHPNA
ncbi:hypothetical protein E8E78_03965 [Pseudomonas sp. BN505]|nr:hypothetical protein [Pseudomonas sp. BN605]MDH4855765.1 hypothetical protein [Pseudomonas sp. BN505]